MKPDAPHATLGNPAQRVLLVEDEPTIAITLRDDLEEQGHVVTYTDDGRRALQLVGEHSFDAVIADFRLPGADGMQVLEAARRRWQQTRLLLITAFAPDHHRARLRAQAAGLLQKPFANTAVLAWLQGDRSQ